MISTFRYFTLKLFCFPCIQAIRTKFPKSPGMLIHLLTLANQASEPTGLASALFCRLLWFALMTGFFCSASFSVLPWDLPSLVLFPSPWRSHAQALCVGFASKQTNESSDWNLPTSTPTQRMPTSSHTLLETI